jgi:hypothetical protein
MLVVVLNLIPKEVSMFTMEMNKGDVMRYAKQEDGGWSLVQPQSKSNPTFHVAGTKLTVKADDRAQTLDLAKILGVGENADWHKLKQTQTGTLPLQIEGKTNGVDFILQAKKGAESVSQVINVRWQGKETK